MLFILFILIWSILILCLAYYVLVVLPVKRLNLIVNKISNGDFKQIVMHKSFGDMANLESNIENMSESLSSQIQDISKERSKLYAIITGMAEGVIAVNQNNRIILANPVVEQTFSTTYPEIKDKTIRAGLKNNQLADLLLDTLAKNKIIEKEIDLTLSLGKCFIAHASPIKNVGAVCIIYDITQMRKLENYRAEFVANISHELKTPLTAIRGYVETLLGGAIDDQKTNRQFLEKIDKHTQNLCALIEDILAISKFEVKREIGPFATVNLKEVIHRALDTISIKCKKREVSIKGTCAEAVLEIKGLEEHVYRAILNLLDNAVNYSDPGQEINISCLKQDNVIKLNVIDHGFGIPKEDLPRVFERFYRVEKSRSRDEGGTGLGLAIVKHVMNLHNGNVNVESELGKGSKFTLTFPAK